MTDILPDPTPSAGRRARRWRLMAWSAAGALLLLPLVAMQFTGEMAWTLSDFVLMGVLLGSVGGAFELAVRMSRDPAYRAGVGLALVGAFLLVCINGAVGIIGSEDEPANLLYGVVLAVGVIGAIAARLRARGLAHVLFAMAAVQVAIGIAAAVAGWGGAASGPAEIAGVTALFAVLFVGAGALFRQAAAREVAR